MTAWISNGDIKARLGVTDPNGAHREDALFSIVAEESCAWLEQQVGRKFLTASYSWIFDGNGAAILPMPIVPISTVSALYIGTDSITIGTADEYRLGTADAYYTKDRVVYPGRFPRGFGNVKVTWTAGYSASAIPAHVKGLAVTVAILKWKERERYGDQRRQAGQQTIDYVRELKGQDLLTYNELMDWRGMYVPVGVEV